MKDINISVRTSRLVFADHGMTNDRDLNFEDYAYEVSSWRSNIQDREQAHTNTLKFARFAFGQLKEAGRYPLLLVEESQKKLDSFDPHKI